MIMRIENLLRKVGFEYVATFRRVAAVFALGGVCFLVMMIGFFVIITLSSFMSYLF